MEGTCTSDPTMIYGASLHPQLVESGHFSKHVTCGSVAEDIQEVEKKSGKP